VERLGGNQLIPLDVRVIATTNRNLKAEVQAGRFREDLFYRLAVFPVPIPALRERPADIVPLAQTLLARHAADRTLSLSKAAQARLLAHDWRGNVRELENCVQRAAILCASDQIESSDIYFEDAFSESPEVVAAEPAPRQLDGNLKDREKQLIVRALQTVDGCRKDAAELLGISPRTLRYKLAKLKEQGVAIPAVS
jgi:two-component system response regulator FlrC